MATSGGSNTTITTAGPSGASTRQYGAVSLPLVCGVGVGAHVPAIATRQFSATH
jgi:hypothetical protein